MMDSPHQLAARDNHALFVHPPAGAERLSTNGSSWLFAVCAVFWLTFLLLFLLTHIRRVHERFFHHLFLVALLVGAIAYFAMASDLAWTVVGQVNSLSHKGSSRQIFWAKYVYWVVAFPAVTTALGVLSGVSWVTIVYQVFLAWTWVVGLLVAAYTPSNYKWGFFALATLAHLALLFSTLGEGRAWAGRTGYGKHHTGLSAWVNLLWILYAIAWGVSDGGNRIGVTPSFIFFGILDVLFLPVLTFAFLFLARRWDYDRLGLHYTSRGRVPQATPAYTDKPRAAPAATGPAVV